MSTQTLFGRTAVITGSTSGIGAATAHALAARGARVVVTGRDDERGARVDSDIEAAGGAAVLLAGDLMSPPAALRELAAAWTKAAEAQLARSWAAEFGPRGVRVNTVAPGAAQGLGCVRESGASGPGEYGLQRFRSRRRGK